MAGASHQDTLGHSHPPVFQFGWVTMGKWGPSPCPRLALTFPVTPEAPLISSLIFFLCSMAAGVLQYHGWGMGEGWSRGGGRPRVTQDQGCGEVELEAASHSQQGNQQAHLHSLLQPMDRVAHEAAHPPCPSDLPPCCPAPLPPAGCPNLARPSIV